MKILPAPSVDTKPRDMYIGFAPQGAAENALVIPLAQQNNTCSLLKLTKYRSIQTSGIFLQLPPQVDTPLRNVGVSGILKR